MGNSPRSDGILPMSVVGEIEMSVNSPVPVELDIEGQPSRTLQPGRYEAARSA